MCVLRVNILCAKGQDFAPFYDFVIRFRKCSVNVLLFLLFILTTFLFVI